MARTITFLGTPQHLVGTPPEAGQKAPDFTTHIFAGAEGLAPVTLGSLPAKARLISVVPSVDTGVCSKQTKTFNEALGALGDSVAAYTVSMDLPFAQSRYCGAEGIESMQTVSDFRDRSFGTNWGLLVEELGLLARAVYVVDKDDTIVHAEVMDEMTHEPDYDAAMAALKSIA